MLLGLVAVLIFSLTLPVSKFAVLKLHPIFVWAGRAALAAMLAALFLFLAKAKFPTRQQRRDIFFVTLGVVLGWPGINTYAVMLSTSTQAAVANGLLTLATALIGVGVAKERPTAGFWALAVLGCVVVMAYALYRGGGQFAMTDGLFFLGVCFGGIGYAYGGKAAKSMAGWQVISWALLLGLPITLPLSIYSAPTRLNEIDVMTWTAFLYVAIMSQYIGFFFWYKALALGGIARV
ncbi:MAG: hypothetical protein RLZZ502_259, partial [Pseudomonadota bacterium]